MSIESIVKEFLAERERQEAKFPNQHIPNFPSKMDFAHARAERDQAQELTDRCAEKGVVTWWHVLREEVFEAFAEEDEVKLRIELKQVMAVAGRWMEDLDRSYLTDNTEENHD